MMIRPIARGMGSIPIVQTDVTNRAPGSVISQQWTTAARRLAGPAILLAPAVAAAAPIAEDPETVSCVVVFTAMGFGALCGALTAVSARCGNLPGAIAGMIGGACGIVAFAWAANDMHHELARLSADIAVLAAAASAFTNLRAVDRRIPPTST